MKIFAKAFFLSWGILLSLTFNNNLFSQIGEQESAKYWFYRHRLRTEFMIMGLSETEHPQARTSGFGGGYGHSIPAHNANANFQGEIKWSDGTIDLGFYIGVLASEYKILKDAGLETSHTLEELFYALKAYERLDSYSNSLFNQSTSSLKNGFFIRDDVTSDIYDENPVFEKYKDSNGEYVTQTGFLDNQDESADDIKTITPEQFHSLLLGFALVKKCVGNVTYNGMHFKNSVMLYAETTAKYLEDRKWKVKNENDDLSKFGKVFRSEGHAWITAKAVGYISDKYSSNEFLDELNPLSIIDFKSRLGVLRSRVGRLKTFTVAHMAMGTAIGDPGPTESFLKRVQSENIIVADPIFGIQLRQFVDYDIYYLLWNFLRDKNGSINDPQNIDSKLRKAPCYGLMWKPSNLESTHPYYLGVNGWRSDNRWVKASQRYDGDRASKMNGLDYMLLYNLYVLYFSQHNPELVGELSSMTPGAFPLDYNEPTLLNSNIYAFNEVKMSAKVTLNQEVEILGKVTLTSGFSFKAVDKRLRIIGGSRNACGDVLDKYGDVMTLDNSVLFPASANRNLYLGEPNDTVSEEIQKPSKNKSNYKPLNQYLAEKSSLQQELDPIAEPDTFIDSKVFVFPNPTINKVNISMPALDENTLLEIIDLNGTVLVSQVIEQKTTRTSINLPFETLKGIYFVRLSTNKIIIIKKLIIK